jgi:fatty-acyl-CoA synthase
MAALVLRDGAAFDGAAFAAWLDGQPDLGPKWRPTFVRVSAALPSTPTNKILTRTLIHEKFRHDRVADDPLYRRARGAPEFRPFSESDEAALRAEFESHGRSSAWDL